MTHEKRDLPLSAIVKWVAFAFTTIVVAFLAITFIYHRRIQIVRGSERQTSVLGQFPKPQLQSEPRQGLYAFRANGNAVLSSYAKQGVVNGTVQVPVERAIEEMTK